MGSKKIEKLSVSSQEKINNVLNKIEATMDLERKRNVLAPEEEDIRKYILQQFPKLERAPKIEEIKEAFGISSLQEIISVLDRLEKLDIIYRQEGTQKIISAYPFSGVPTSHEVILKREKKIYAMCAIDALGIPFMFEQDVIINSSCPHCEGKITIIVEGKKIVEQNPQGIIVWVGLKYSVRMCTSICKTLLFFCSEKHFEEWREKNIEEEGEILALNEALWVGKGVFESFLK